MSVETPSLPAWKQAIIDKRKKYDEEESRHITDRERLESLPAWKRDILVKKQSQKNTMIFLGKEQPQRKSDVGTKDYNGLSANAHRGEPQATRVSTYGRNNSATGIGDTAHINHNHIDQDTGSSPVMHSGATYEQQNPAHNNVDVNPTTDGTHPVIVEPQVDGADSGLIPVKNNPWYVSDQYKRRSRGSSGSVRTMSTGSSGQRSSETSRGSYADPSQSPVQQPSNANMLQVGANRDRIQSADDSAFVDNEEKEEVQYGRGFVSKLLQRFRNLSSREDGATAPVMRRAHSLENVLDEPDGHSLPSRPLSDGIILNNVESVPNSVTYNDEPLVPPERLSRTSRREIKTEPGSTNQNTQMSIEQETNDTHVEMRDRSDRSPSPGKRSSYPRHLYFKGVKEGMMAEELPRPNTVSSTRSFFEVVSPTSTDRRKSWEMEVEESSGTKVMQDIAKEVEIEKRRSLSPVQKSPESQVTNRQTADHSERPKSDSISRSTDSTDIVRNSSNVFRDKSPSRTFYFASTASQSKSSKPAPNHVEVTKPHTNESVSGKSMVFTARTNTQVPKPGQTTSFKYDAKPQKGVAQSASQSSNRVIDKNSNVEKVDKFNDENVIPTAPPRFKKRKAPPAPVPATVAATAPVKVVTPARAPTVVPSAVPPRMPATVVAERTPASVPVVRQSVPKPSPVTSQPVKQVSNSSSAVSKPNFTVSNKTPNGTQNNNNQKATPVVLKMVETREYQGFTSVENAPGPKVAKTSKPRQNVRKPGQIWRPRRIKKGPPGDLVIQPSSNQLTSKDKNSQRQFLNLIKYRDITRAKFENTIKAVDYLTREDLDEIYEEDVPMLVSDLDEVADSIPVTNIDDVAVDDRSLDFIGGGVKLKKSSLSKGKKKKMRIQFDNMTTTFEYPSEVTMMEMYPPEHGEPDPNHSPIRNSFDEDDAEDDIRQPSGGLKSTPGVGSAGSLGSYQSRMQYDYHFGMNINEPTRQPPPRQAPQKSPKETEIKPTETGDSWSGSATSDLLF